MINIVVDWGNSSIKAALFDDTQLLYRGNFKSPENLRDFLNQPHDNIIVSTVNREAENILNASHAKGKKLVLSASSNLPVKINYETPQSLGVDRIAAACGAFQLYPFEDCLIIDMGTCINYEFIDRSGIYWGGIISPGMRMRFNAMHTLTARLPLVEPVSGPNLIGDSTSKCMQSGVMNGILEELNGFISKFNNKYPSLRVILCGGDAGFFENQLKPSIFAAPEIVLMGLNRILIHNVEN